MNENTKMMFASYPNDAAHMEHYIAYQARYATLVRESDKVILALLAECQARGDLLDIGCSTGNLLRHIKAAFPHLRLTGGDLSDMQLAECRRADDLRNVAFEKMDILALPRQRFDIVVANAILYGFAPAEFARCIESIAAALRPGGVFIAFDFFHPYAQELAIIETSAGFPAGHPLHMRSMPGTERVIKQAGFARVQFLPFNIPIDLSPEENSLQTRTVRSEGGERLQFRGMLFQPWCHLLARLPQPAP